MFTPPVFIAFDVLQLDARGLRPRPLADRRPSLDEWLDDVDMVLPCRRLPDDRAKADDESTLDVTDHDLSPATAPGRALLRFFRDAA